MPETSAHGIAAILIRSVPIAQNLPCFDQGPHDSVGESGTPDPYEVNASDCCTVRPGGDAIRDNVPVNKRARRSESVGAQPDKLTDSHPTRQPHMPIDDRVPGDQGIACYDASGSQRDVVRHMNAVHEKAVVGNASDSLTLRRSPIHGDVLSYLITVANYQAPTAVIEELNVLREPTQRGKRVDNITFSDVGRAKDGHMRD
ncbi:hypothetical protein GA0115259_109198 [Streptomyces sp. MnatMP-M17]|nr:hypothetical protein GA0115259_109198 [Streptomyces sp. MnatMP-M17]